MPGPYAHITLLHELMRPDREELALTRPQGLDAVLNAYFSYCALGAVSPDYPNLAPAGSAADWADAMHCTRACDMLTSGIARLRATEGAVRDKQLAWLLGYCAHLVTDLTIHPVVQAKVGPYAENQRQHRICEIHQDSYIYRRMNLGNIGESGLFADLVAQCVDPRNPDQLDGDIISLWEGMFEDVHPGWFRVNPPDIGGWHRGFMAGTGANREGEARLFPLAGRIAAKTGLAYPVHEEVDRQFVDRQPVPTARIQYLSYDAIFDRAVGNVAAFWCLVHRLVYSDIDAALPGFGDWNLDDGCDGRGRLVFW